jgi:microcystin-dependent protein
MASDSQLMSSVDLWPLSWAPMGWMLCNGQTLAISSYSALFALIGITFGGNGTSNFNLPDLRGRVPVGAGIAGSGTNYAIGVTGGVEQVTLTAAQAPAVPHIHPATSVDPNFTGNATGTVTPGANDGSRGAVPSNSPTNSYPATMPSGTNNYATPANTHMGSTPLTITVNITKSSPGSVTVGANVQTAPATPHENRMPYMPLNYIIAVEGIFPSRP